MVSGTYPLFSSWIYPLKMVIVHSHVSLPDGITIIFIFFLGGELKPPSRLGGTTGVKTRDLPLVIQFFAKINVINKYTIELNGPNFS